MLFIFLILIALFMYLYKKTVRHVPILMYHRIADVPGDRNCLPADRFAWQLAYLHKHQYHTLSLAELAAYLDNGTPLPPRSVLLTFDDGYKDNLTAALPLLQKYNMCAVVFPISGWLGRANEWEQLGKSATVTMSLDELRIWQRAGMDIASHTVDHPFLNVCDTARQQYELAASKRELEQKLQTPIEFLCYPYGRFNEQTIKLAKENGYKGAFAIFENVSLLKLNPFALPRVPIPSGQKKWEFKLKVSSAFILFVALRQAERKFKHLLKK